MSALTAKPSAISVAPRWRSPRINWRGGHVDIPEHTHRALAAYIEDGQVRQGGINGKGGQT